MENPHKFLKITADLREQEPERPAKLKKCDCGREHDFSYMRGDFQCECGQLFNAFGQRLRPRDQWEENEDND